MTRTEDWSLERRLLDAFDAAVFLAEAEGTVVHANASAQRLYAGVPLVGEDLSTRLFTESEQVAFDVVFQQVRDGHDWRGQLQLSRPDGTSFAADVGCLPVTRDHAVVGLFCVVRDLVSGRHELSNVRRLGTRLTRLARVTADLVMADSVQKVTTIVTSHCADAVGATMASLTLREGEDSLRLLRLRGGPEGAAEQWATYSMETATPASEVVRTGEPLILTGADAIAARYPELVGIGQGERTIACLPLRVTDRTIGVIGLSFPGVRHVEVAEVEFLQILADTCAQALERITAQEDAAQQTAKLRFLANASSELSSSLDYEATLAKVAHLAVPDFADWCAIDLVEDGRLNRLAVAHVDPAKVEFALAIQERYPPNPDSPRGAWNAMRTGQSELIAEITDELLVAAAVDEEQLRLARQLHLRSAVTVPLIARGKVLGVISWVWAESERNYTTEDLAFAEDLAKRAAIAIDNAELHSETLAAAVRLQRAVLPDAVPDVPGWELASHYSPSGRTDVGGDFYDAVPLGEGRLALFVGDVMGRGVEAAASMAQMRAAVRAYTAVDPTPDSVLRKLDLMFAQYPTDQLVTLVYLLMDRSRDELTIANAGHPAPVLLRSDLTYEQLPPAEGTPLGVHPERRPQSTVPMWPGDTVLAYTDGLIERRDEDIDAGQGRVHQALSVLAQPDLSAALDGLVKSLREPTRDDDVAALAARRLG